MDEDVSNSSEQIVSADELCASFRRVLTPNGRVESYRELLVDAVNAILPALKQWSAGRGPLPCDLEDYAQSALIDVLRRLEDDSLEPIRDIRGFLYQCAKWRLGHDLQRQCNIRNQNKDALSRQERVENPYEKELNSAHLRKALELARDEIEQVQWECFRLAKLNGWKSARIAKRLSIPASTVRSHISHTKSTVRRHYEQLFSTPPIHSPPRLKRTQPRLDGKP